MAHTHWQAGAHLSQGDLYN